jgi:hypothetical protein
MEFDGPYYTQPRPKIVHTPCFPVSINAKIASIRRSMATDVAAGSTFCWGARHGLGLEVPLAARDVARRGRRSVMLRIGSRVRFVEPFRPDAIAPSAVGIVVLIEPLPTVFGPPQRLRAKFGDYISPWLMPAQLEAVD